MLRGGKESVRLEANTDHLVRSGQINKAIIIRNPVRKEWFAGAETCDK
jgi:hypothetical protein